MKKYLLSILVILSGLVSTGCSDKDEPGYDMPMYCALFKCDDPRADLFTGRKFWLNSINVGAEGGEFKFTLSTDISDFNKATLDQWSPMPSANFFFKNATEYFDPGYKKNCEAKGEFLPFEDGLYRCLEWEIESGLLPSYFSGSPESFSRLMDEGGHETVLWFGSMVWGHNEFTIKINPNDKDVPRAVKILINGFPTEDAYAEMRANGSYFLAGPMEIFVFQSER